MDTGTTCAACGGQLRLRLGQLECASCGALASEQVPGASIGGRIEQRDASVQALEEHLYSSRDNNRRSKYWCLATYALCNLFPDFIAVVILMFLMQMSRMSQQPIGKGLETLAAIAMAAIGIALVVNGIQVFVFYLMLFSDTLWLKWVCLIYMLIQVPLTAVEMFMPGRVLSPEDMQQLGAVAGAWIVLLVGFFALFFVIWVIRLVWPDIRGLQLNRKLQRHFV